MFFYRESSYADKYLSKIFEKRNPIGNKKFYDIKSYSEDSSNIKETKETKEITILKKNKKNEINLNYR